MKSIAFKALTAEQWAAFEASGVFAGTPVDLADAFIHLSAADQLDETIKRHFPAVAVYVAQIDLTAYADAVRWEPSRGGALFPHIYGQPLRIDTVIDVDHRLAQT